MAEPLREIAPEPVLESQHCRAICEETGERLRQSLKPQEASPMPRRLSGLLTRLSAKLETARER